MVSLCDGVVKVTLQKFIEWELSKFQKGAEKRGLRGNPNEMSEKGRRYTLNKKAWE
jgi:hypothetical protein